MTEAPIFIIGVPRSGTTLLATLLEGHPELYVDDEAIALRALHLRARLNTLPPGEAVREATDEDPRLQRFYDQLPKQFSTTGPALLQMLNAVAGGRRYVDKSPDALPETERLAGLFPGSRFLLVVRDPRPTVASLRRRQYLELREAALLWRDWTRYVIGLQRWWPEGTLLRVRYEDLVTEPKETLRHVCTFLGVTFREEMLDLRASTATGGAGAYVKSTFDVAALERWRKSMPRSDQRLVEAICRPEMKLLNYPRENPDAAALEPGYWTLYRHQVLHKFRLLRQPVRKHMSGRRLHDRRIPLGTRVGALVKAILRGALREELLGGADKKRQW